MFNGYPFLITFADPGVAEGNDRLKAIAPFLGNSIVGLTKVADAVSINCKDTIVDKRLVAKIRSNALGQSFSHCFINLKARSFDGPVVLEKQINIYRASETHAC